MGRNRIFKFALLPTVALNICLLLQGLCPAGSYGWNPRSAFRPFAASPSTVAQTDSRLAEYFRGITLYRAGQWAQAASIFEALLEKNPEFSLAAGAAADSYRNLKKSDKAQSYYALAARLCEGKLQRRTQWDLNLDMAPVMADLIYYRYRMGQWDECWRLLESLEPGGRENFAGLAAMLFFCPW